MIEQKKEKVSGLYIDYEKVMSVADPENSWLVTNYTNESQNSVDYRTKIRMYRTSWLRSEGCGTSCQEKCGDDCFVEDHGEVCGKVLFEEVLARKTTCVCAAIVDGWQGSRNAEHRSDPFAQFSLLLLVLRCVVWTVESWKDNPNYRKREHNKLF